MARATEQRTKCTRCDWVYWQEPLTDEQGRYIDQLGEVIHATGVDNKIARYVRRGMAAEDAREKAESITPVMIWRERGNPCYTCLDTQFRALRDGPGSCAQGQCKKPRDCETHRHLYNAPPIEEMGAVDEAGRRHVILSADCTVVADAIAELMWLPEHGGKTYEEVAELVPACRGCYGQFHYPEPEENGDGTKRVEAYHRGSNTFVALRGIKREAREPSKRVITLTEIASVLEGVDVTTLNARLSALSQPQAITEMAMRILARQAEAGHRAASYGEGLSGTIPLDIDAEERLAALEREQQIEALEAEQRAEQQAEEAEVDQAGWDTYSQRDNTDTSSYDDEDDGRATRRQQHDDEDDDGESIDLGVWL